jgi:peptide/nickel transport system substrate-binding protein
MYVDIDGMEPEDAADKWLADNCDRWTGWTGASSSACPEAPVVAASTAGQGGTVTILYWQAASTLNPYLSGGWKDRDAGAVILEPLAEFDDQGVLVPALATEIPTVGNGGVSEDLKSITWTLQDGLLFSDGSPVTSDDVVFSYEYCSHPDTGCTGLSGFDGVTSVVADDDHTITITFAEATPFPYVPFVSNSYPVISRAQFGDCVGAASAECTEQNFAPIGTGPFKIESFTTNDTAVYVMNENYRGVSEGKPYFGRVVIKGGGDAPSTARSVLELGEADYAWNLQVEPEILAGMVAGGKGKVISAFSTMVERLMVNQTNPDPDLGDNRSEWMDGNNPHPFLTDPVVGRALSIAIDRQTLVDVGYGDAGRPTCNVWPAPPAQTSTTNDECLTQDIDLANQLLDDAGYADTDGDGVRETPDGVPLKILYQTSTNTVRQATQELIKQDWAKIGVETELRNIDASVFFGGDPASPDTYGKFYADIEMYTNGAAGVDSQAYMGNWTTSNISGESTNWQGSNVQRFQSDEYDALYSELTQTADTARRNEITIALNDLVVGNYSIIPLIHRGSVSAVTNSLTGYKLNPWDAELWNIGDWGRE